MPPCARWPLLFFISPACISHRESPLACSFSRLGRRICLRVPAGPCCSSSHRRAFFIPFPRRHGRFAAWGVEYATVCPLALAVARLAGVHFLSRFPAVMVVSTVPAGNMSPCARRPLPLLTSPACKNEAVGKSIALHRGRCDSF